MTVECFIGLAREWTSAPDSLFFMRWELCNRAVVRRPLRPTGLIVHYIGRAMLETNKPTTVELNTHTVLVSCRQMLPKLQRAITQSAGRRRAVKLPMFQCATELRWHGLATSARRSSCRTVSVTLCLSGVRIGARSVKILLQ